MNWKFFLYGIAAAALLPAVVCAQASFDSSGNSLLNGTYFIREVLNANISSIGQIGEAESLTGTISFSGGSYTLTAQLSDNTVSSGAPQQLSTMGNYSVNASGMFAMDDPLSNGDTLYGGIGPSAIVGSASRSSSIDFMVAVPIAASASNSSLSGAYRVVGLEYPNGDVTEVSNYSFLVNPDGAGNLNIASLTGHAVNVSDNLYSQSISGATYSLSSTSGTMTFPAQATGTSLISGTKQFFVSADGNILVGGSLDGYDIQVGINVAGSAASNSFNGTYFSAGEDYDSSTFAANGHYYLDAFSGSAHAITTNGNATVLADQRINPDNEASYDFTFLDQFALASGGTGNETYYLDFVGAGEAARVVTGQSTSYAIELDIQAQPLMTSGSVILNPLGIVNGANYLPITNPVAPGEFVTLFGSGLGPSSVATAALPYPATLKNVGVSLDGTTAPVQLAGSGQINCIVPYELSDPFAVFQVIHQGVSSNTVSLFSDTSAPGVFTLDQSGIGSAAALHPDGSIVNANNPATVGEEIAVYATGLGAVTPASPDGVGATTTTLSYTDDTFGVNVDNVQATVAFSGLAPGFAGLYQVNFVVPEIPDSGAVNLDLFDETNGAYNSIASLEVSAARSSAKSALLHSDHRKEAIKHGRVRSKTDYSRGRVVE